MRGIDRDRPRKSKVGQRRGRECDASGGLVALVRTVEVAEVLVEDFVAIDADDEVVWSPDARVGGTIPRVDDRQQEVDVHTVMCRQVGERQLCGRW